MGGLVGLAPHGVCVVYCVVVVSGGGRVVVVVAAVVVVACVCAGIGGLDGGLEFKRLRKLVLCVRAVGGCLNGSWCLDCTHTQVACECTIGEVQGWKGGTCKSSQA